MKKIWIVAGAVWAGYLGVKAFGDDIRDLSPDIYDGTVETWNKAVQIVWNVWEFINNNVSSVVHDLLTEIPKVGPQAAEAAPFAVPMIAGWYLAKKLADVAKIEDKVKRKWMMLGGWITGALTVFSQNDLSNYTTGAWLTAAALVPGLYFGKWVLKWFLWAWWVPIGALASIPGWAKKGAKKWWGLIK